jgi:serine/threonine protein phosphatase 1
MPRTIAIGDIHGCSRALDRLLADVDPRPVDTVVTLGDYVDRGPDSKGVLDRLIDLSGRTKLIPLRGNHELMLLEAHKLGEDRYLWLECGGQATLDSYGGTFDDISADHKEFIRSMCVDWFECATHFFVHANAQPDMPLDAQPESELFWQPFFDRGPHENGKIMVCGHTQQRSGVPLNVGHAICLDTWAYGDGFLSALDICSGRVWQSSQRGERRTSHIDEYLTDGEIDL